jgi:hypothetical protein
LEVDSGFLAALFEEAVLVAGTAEVASRGFFAPAPAGSAGLDRAKTPMLLELPPIPAPQHLACGASLLVLRIALCSAVTP